MMGLKFSRILAFFFCLSASAFLLLHISIDTDNDSEEIIKVTVIEKNKTYIKELPLGSSFKDLGIESDEYSKDYVLHDNEVIILEEKNEELISINSCSKEELMKLPGIGPVIAERIIEYRNKYGLFETIEEIKNVSGIGDKKYEKIKELIIL